MLADLDLALKEPLKLVEKLFAHGGSSLDGFELRVQETFQLLLKDTARDEIVSITSSSDVSNLPRAGSLVRFRAMVQDTGYGTELYRAVGDTSRDQVLMYGLEETETPGAGGSASTPPASVQDYSNLRERQVFYVVSPPGETKWVKRALDGTQLESAMSHLDLAPSSSTRSNPCAMLPNKAPLPHEPHFGMIVKIYTDLGEKLRSTDVYEFVGVLGESPISNGFEDLFDRGGHDEAASDSSPFRVVPALHVLYAAPAPSPVASPVLDAADLEPIRTELIEYIAREGGLGGDFEAAEWILLALIAHIHTRHASGLALGSLSLNLAFPIASSSSSASMRAQESSSSQTSSTGAGPGSRLVHVLESIVPLLAPLSPTISSLNDLLTTRVSPRSRDESLDSGLLQLSKGTTVVVDLVQLGEGKLNDTGVRNLRSLATTISQQKLAYEFPFSSFELETDLNFIVVSEGKAIVPTDCVVYVEPRRCEETGRDARERDDESRLDRFRSYLRSVRESEFSIPPRMSDVIQADFVERRQASHAGPSSSSSSSSSKTAMTQEDLLFRMTVSRLVATSLGKRELDESSWTRTAELDERRKDRAPL